MHRRQFVVSSGVGTLGLLAAMESKATAAPSSTPASAAATRKILIAGGNYDTAFIRYMAELTGKARPRLCYLPTASADNAASTVAWFKNCAPLSVEAHAQDTFIESLTQKEGW